MIKHISNYEEFFTLFIIYPMTKYLKFAIRILGKEVFELLVKIFLQCLLFRIQSKDFFKNLYLVDIHHQYNKVQVLFYLKILISNEIYKIILKLSVEQIKT